MTRLSLANRARKAVEEYGAGFSSVQEDVFLLARRVEELEALLLQARNEQAAMSKERTESARMYEKKIKEMGLQADRDAVQFQKRITQLEKEIARATKDVAKEVENLKDIRKDLKPDERVTSLKFPKGTKLLPKLTHSDRILIALAQQGGTPISRQEISFYSGVSLTSSSTNTAFADLLDAGLIVNETEKGRSLYSISDKGLGSFEEPFPDLPRAYDLLQALINREGKHVQKLLKAVGQKPENMTRAQLIAMAGVSSTSSSTNTAIKRLANLGIIETGGGKILFADWYVKAVAVDVRAFDSKTGETRYVRPG